MSSSQQDPDDGHWSVSAPWVFRKTEYKVSADVREDVLIIQVEDCLAADQWTGQFDTKHIEELTRKTGNFKQFPIFLNMLESAITKSSESVTLDLLTYADLESLRNKKAGSGRVTSPAGRKQTQSKRYLILTYSVEFDRIHYPLALPYSGRPDPAHLQETIRQLQRELERTRRQATSHRHTDLAKLRREYESLASEKDELEEALEMLRQDVVLTRGTGSNKEMRFMKKAVQNLEEELMKERSKHQKLISKKNEDLKNLLQELEEVKLSERTLKTRLKSLSNELSILKHGLRTTPGTYSRPSSKKKTPTMTERRTSRSSVERVGRGSLRGPARRSLEGSVERRPMRTPSPRLPRFDPSAFVESKKRKQRDSEIRRERVKVCVRSRPPRSVSRERRSTSRNSSRRSSLSSVQSNISGGRGAGKRGRSLAWESPQNTSNSSSKRKTSRNSSILEHSTEISEIDARLTALQEFMKRSIESSKYHTKR